MRFVVMVLFAVMGAAEGRAADALGRLFFTPEQRVQLDAARSQRSRATLAPDIPEEAASAPETLTYQGVVRRSDGKSTVWINGQALNDGTAAGRLPPAAPRSDGSVVVKLPQSDRVINLKVGQQLELDSGTVGESYLSSASAIKSGAKRRRQVKAATAPGEEGLAARPTGPEDAATVPETGEAPLANPPMAPRAAAGAVATEAQLKAALEQMRRRREAEQRRESNSR